MRSLQVEQPVTCRWRALLRLLCELLQLQQQTTAVGKQALQDGWQWAPQKGSNSREGIYSPGKQLLASSNRSAKSLHSLQLLAANNRTGVHRFLHHAGFY
jgi:hypothetical protein